MARIIFQDGSDSRDFAAIQSRLAQLNIALRHWPAPTVPRARALMTQAALADAEKEELLLAVDNRFAELQREAGYAARDLVVIHDAVPGLAEMLAKFAKIHYHADDEVRYILAGKGYFGFVDGDEGQFMLEVNADDYINVPANTEHWFTLGDSTGIKAVRYFIDNSGWSPNYTGRALLFD